MAQDNTLGDNPLEVDKSQVPGHDSSVSRTLDNGTTIQFQGSPEEIQGQLKERDDQRDAEKIAQERADRVAVLAGQKVERAKAAAATNRAESAASAATPTPPTTVGVGPAASKGFKEPTLGFNPRMEAMIMSSNKAEARRRKAAGQTLNRRPSRFATNDTSGVTNPAVITDAYKNVNIMLGVGGADPATAKPMTEEVWRTITPSLQKSAEGLRLLEERESAKQQFADSLDETEFNSRKELDSFVASAPPSIAGWAKARAKAYAETPVAGGRGGDRFASADARSLLSLQAQAHPDFESEYEVGSEAYINDYEAQKKSGALTLKTNTRLTEETEGRATAKKDKMEAELVKEVVARADKEGFEREEGMTDREWADDFLAFTNTPEYLVEKAQNEHDRVSDEARDKMLKDMATGDFTVAGDDGAAKKEIAEFLTPETKNYLDAEKESKPRNGLGQVRGDHIYEYSTDKVTMAQTTKTQADMVSDVLKMVQKDPKIRLDDAVAAVIKKNVTGLGYKAYWKMWERIRDAYAVDRKKEIKDFEKNVRGKVAPGFDEVMDRLVDDDFKKEYGTVAKQRVYFGDKITSEPSDDEDYRRAAASSLYDDLLANEAGRLGDGEAGFMLAGAIEAWYNDPNDKTVPDSLRRALEARSEAARNVRKALHLEAKAEEDEIAKDKKERQDKRDEAEVAAKEKAVAAKEKAVAAFNKGFGTGNLSDVQFAEGNRVIHVTDVVSNADGTKSYSIGDVWASDDTIVMVPNPLTPSETIPAANQLVADKMAEIRNTPDKVQRQKLMQAASKTINGNVYGADPEAWAAEMGVFARTDLFRSRDQMKEDFPTGQAALQKRYETTRNDTEVAVLRGDDETFNNLVGGADQATGTTPLYEKLAEQEEEDSKDYKNLHISSLDEIKGFSNVFGAAANDPAVAAAWNSDTPAGRKLAMQLAVLHRITGGLGTAKRIFDTKVKADITKFGNKFGARGMVITDTASLTTYLDTIVETINHRARSPEDVERDGDQLAAHLKTDMKQLKDEVDDLKEDVKGFDAGKEEIWEGLTYDKFFEIVEGVEAQLEEDASEFVLAEKILESSESEDVHEVNPIDEPNRATQKHLKLLYKYRERYGKEYKNSKWIQKFNPTINVPDYENTITGPNGTIIPGRKDIPVPGSVQYRLQIAAGLDGRRAV